MYNYTTRAPGDATSDWDFLNVSGKVEADTLLLPAEQSTCALLK